MLFNSDRSVHLLRAVAWADGLGSLLELRNKHIAITYNDNLYIYPISFVEQVRPCHMPVGCHRVQTKSHVSGFNHPTSEKGCWPSAIASFLPTATSGITTVTMTCADVGSANPDIAGLGVRLSYMHPFRKLWELSLLMRDVSDHSIIHDPGWALIYPFGMVHLSRNPSSLTQAPSHREAQPR